MSDRHASTEELLEARDGFGSAWAKRHLAECRECSAALFGHEQLRARLRSLPSLAPPRDRWSVIERAARFERRRRRWHAAIGLTAAAALTVLTFLSVRPDHGSYDAVAEQAALERAMAQSRALEQTLRALRPESRSLPGAAASVVAELESRLSRLDVELADPAAAGALRLDLWRERAGLMSALVDVHVTRAAAAGL
jgi:hypothetical protein